MLFSRHVLFISCSQTLELSSCTLTKTWTRGSRPTNVVFRSPLVRSTASVVNVKPLPAGTRAFVFIGGKSVAQHSGLIHHRLLDVVGKQPQDHSFYLSHFWADAPTLLSYQTGREDVFIRFFCFAFSWRVPPARRRNSAGPE